MGGFHLIILLAAAVAAAFFLCKIFVKRFATS